VIVEADGGPLGVVVAGANVHDTKLLKQTIEAIVVDRPKPTDKTPQHLEIITVHSMLHFSQTKSLFCGPMLFLSHR
jgi:hypothetical protein